MNIRIVTILLLVVSCKHPTGTGPDSGPGIGSRIIQCTSQAVQQQWPRVLPSVNQCLATLANDADVTPCLLGLINPAVGITEDVIACVVRARGEEYTAAATVNRNDQVSAKAAARAMLFLRERGYQFAPGGDR